VELFVAVWTVSRMVSSTKERLRWASLWTNRFT